MTTATAEISALFEQGTRSQLAGDAAAAEQAFRQVLALQADIPEVHANLALLLDAAGRREEAERHYRECQRLRPDEVQNLLNFGTMCLDQQRFAEAEALFRQAAALRPDAAAVWSNLGVLLACTQREVEAEACQRRAMACDPGYAAAPFNLSYLLLRQGRYREAWPLFERRDWYAVLERHLGFPRWQGEDLTGKSLLIGFEAGHGDMIQFYRYASCLKALGAARVGGLCHPGLKRLFQRLRGLDEVYALDEDFPAFRWDYWSPPLSLPGYCATDLDSIPADLPYLAPPPEEARQWGERLRDMPERRVGLIWKGNPRFENDAERSLLSLRTLAPLAGVAGVRFCSLQKGVGTEEVAALAGQWPLTDYGPELDDFATTAALIVNLDLVISVDTAVAHLAGALGKPCWLLLPAYKTDWRWLKERRDSPWYPGVMRLFRQSGSGRWDETVREVTRELARWAAERPLTS